MRIGIDIDGCINDAHTLFIDEGIKLKLSKKEKEIKFNNNIWDCDKIFDYNEEEKQEFWHNSFAYSLENAQIRINAKEVIEKLSNEGNEIYLITGRRNFDEYFSKTSKTLYEDTTNWLFNNGIKYNKLIFEVMDKKNACVDNKIDIMIEDWGDNALNISKVIPVLLYKTTYNTEIKGENIIDVYSWYDIYLKIINIKNK